ncbi:MAG TPA: GHKL domain-containing protein [Thiolapillus brandeum]|uniref:histidine kinase n=1 Tax=Thiolapillus brandeum TaxID=1076588 RepID=A0A831KC80_9GAMM|nr:GHKL domain-containing protein [Thiolapillus brandeum]
MVNSGADKKAPVSLRLRLIVLAALVTAISLGLVGLALDAAFQKSSEAGLNTRLESLVYLVLAAAEVADDGSLSVQDDPGDPRLGQPGSGIYARVHGQNDEWTSPSSIGVNLPSLQTIEPGSAQCLTPSADSDFYTFRYGVAYELPDERLLPVTVTILASSLELQQEEQAFRAGLSRSLGAVGIILVLAQLLFLTLGLRPLRRIARDIAGIESGKLQRLEDHYPKELEPLIRNINNLLETEKANQTRYSHALDSLAHSLKTPLSVIRSSLPADTAAKSELVNNAVSDMQHLIATRLQRAAASTRRTMAPAVDVRTQAERLIQSLTRVYSQNLINIDVIIESGLAFYGEQRDLLELLGNLLDNACKYGGGQVRLSAQQLDSTEPRAGINLQVEDNGPGMVQGESEQLLRRGVRGDERVEGHGFGLAIVLEIVNAYNGEIQITQSDLGGACISVSLQTH